ncbi:MAG: tetratricopeptide repeat protein [Verrucomicrobia bacterium]|nr:tetratricopeptide repeat protein [Verrucomicrobiota bacterium]
MTDNSNPLKSFAATRLPWAVALSSLVLYLTTLHSWISFASLPAVSDVGGWNDLSQSVAPLLYLLTLPLKLLPASMVPMAMNVLAAVFGALTLAMLARSVVLLPHDRTKEQRQREQSDHSLLSLRSNWMPALFAAMVCGLQLSFWQHATAGTGEMLNVLLFAFVIRCLLEYRIGHKTRWLTRAVLVYAMGITNNWGMVGFLPLFCVALLWTARMQLFREGVPLKLALNALVGLSLYLLLPVVAVLSGSGENFLDVLMANLGLQKSFLGSLFSQRLMVLVMASTAILPLLLVSIRWPANFGDTNAAASAITTALLRLVHFLFLAVCIYVAFDHVVSPRKLVNLPQVTGIGAPFLTFYYLGALSIGYFLGYLLLLSGKEEVRKWHKPSELSKALNRGLHIGLQGAALVVIGVLAWQNAGTIFANNKNDITGTYAKWLTDSLPKGKAILFADNGMSPQIQLLHAELARSKSGGQTMLIQTDLLASPDYQVRLAKRSNSLWPSPPEEVLEAKRIDDLQILNMLNAITAAKTPIYYLHPSFGYYFEQFYLEPDKGVFRLRPYPSGADSLDKPALTTDQVTENSSVAEAIEKKFDDFAKESEQLRKNQFLDSLIIMGWLSRNLNQRGVDLIRNNQSEAAEKLFLAACKIYRGSPKGNVVAQANLRQANPESDYEFDKELDRLIGDDELLALSRIDSTLKTYGPFDLTQACFQLGQNFARKTQIRQAYHELTRAAELAKTLPDPVFFIADMFVSYELPDKAKLFIERLAKMNEANPFTPDQQIKLIRLEAGLLLAASGPDAAEKYLAERLKPHMNSLGGLHTMLAFHLDHDQNTKALALLDNWLKDNPDDLATLTDKGQLLSRLKRYDKAVEVYQSALELANSQEESNLISMIAATYTEKGDFNSALKHIDDAIKRTDTDNFTFQKATIYMAMSQHGKAVTLLDTLLDDNPNHEEILLNRAESHMALNQYDLAKEDFSTLQSFAPNDPRSYHRLALIAKEQNQNGEELTNYTLFLKYVDPESVPAEELQRVQTRVKQLQGSKP